MLCLKNFLIWFTVLYVCYCESQVDQGCYGSVEGAGCVENVTESVQVPERFDFVARMAMIQENSTLENSTVQVGSLEFVRDVEVEDEIDVLNATEVELIKREIEVANFTDFNATQVPVMVRSMEIQVENQTVSNLNLTENQTVQVRMVRDVDCVNETFAQTNETNELSVVLRSVDNKENLTQSLNETLIQLNEISENLVVSRNTEQFLNSTESLNQTVVRMARDVNQAELVNSTECENKTVASRNVDGRNFGNECRGVGSCVKGVCDKYSQVFNCVCQPDFEGPTCDKKIVQEKFYELVLNKNFTLDKFSNETILNATYEELVINLVDKIWSEINPEEHYVHLFNYNNLTQYVSIGLEVQKLLLFSKVSLFEVEERLNVFEKVLDGLIEMFETSLLKEQAVEFVAKWEESVNESEVKSVARHVVSPVLIESVKIALNETYYLVRELVDVYEAYLVLNETVKFEKMDQLINSTDKSWVKVIEYGFWHITGQLVGKDESYFMEKSVASVKRSLPKGIYNVFSRVNTNYLFKYVLKPNLNGQTLAAVLKLISRF